MKLKLYIFVLLSIVYAKVASAQQGFHLGGQYGFNSVYILDKHKFGDVPYKYQMTYGNSFGLEAGNNFTDVIGLQLEVNFAQMGQRYVINNEGIDQVRNLNFNYFQIPLMLKVSGGDWKSRFTAMAGPQIGFMTGARIGGNYVDSFQRIMTTDKARFNNIDLGLLVTAGGDISLYHDLYLSLELRMYYGMRAINKDDRVVVDMPNENEKLGNASLGAFAGIHYLFRGKSHKPDGGMNQK